MSCKLKVIFPNPFSSFFSNIFRNFISRISSRIHFMTHKLTRNQLLHNFTISPVLLLFFCCFFSFSFNISGRSKKQNSKETRLFDVIEITVLDAICTLMTIWLVDSCYVFVDLLFYLFFPWSLSLGAQKPHSHIDEISHIVLCLILVYYAD